MGTKEVKHSLHEEQKGAEVMYYFMVFRIQSLLYYTQTYVVEVAQNQLSFDCYSSPFLVDLDC